MDMDNWVADDQAIWATDDEYSNWNADTIPTFSTPNNKNTKSSQSQSHSSDSLSRPSSSKAIGKMFYKTKLCSKFRSGVCPYVTNCNFAHGLQELRKPPPNWQEIVAAHEEERGITVEQHQLQLQLQLQHREEHQIPTITTTDSRSESQRSYKGRHCKKFYTEEGCPYGDTCTFLHDEQSRARESVAISVSPTVGASASPGPTHKPSNWKTRICNKWETTGSCPFGTKCHFAHGFTELHKFGGELMEGGGRDSSLPTETKQASSAVKATDSSVATSLMVPRPDFHQVPLQRPSSVTQLVGQRPLQKWKGPDKISRIYGDWIDDFE